MITATDLLLLASAAIAIIGGLGILGGLWLGTHHASRRYWRGYDRGYAQAEVDIKGLPKSAPVAIEPGWDLMR